MWVESESPLTMHYIHAALVSTRNYPKQAAPVLGFIEV